MNKEDYINSVVSHVKSKRNKQFISKEIGDHIDDGIEFYQSKGYDYETACEKAVSSMGDAHLVGAQLGKLHSKFLDKIIALILLVVYTVSYSKMLSPLIFSEFQLNLFTVLIEFGILFFSILSILFANKFKSRLILSVSFIFTVMYFLFKLKNAVGVMFGLVQELGLFKAILSSLSFCFFSPLLSVDYFVFTFNPDDFSAIINEYILPSNIILPLCTLVFYCAWFSVYVFSFINIKKFANCNYDLKSVNKERKLNLILIIVLLIHLFSVSISTYAVMPNNVDDLFGDASPYYERVMIMESDTPCDMETLYKNVYHGKDNYLCFDLDFAYSGAHITGDKDKFDENYDCISKLKPFGNGFVYESNTLYAGYKADKKYITVVPIHLNSKNRREPAFDKAQWYETASTTEITGELDTDELKSYFYKIDIINADE